MNPASEQLESSRPTKPWRRTGHVFLYFVCEVVQVSFHSSETTPSTSTALPRGYPNDSQLPFIYLERTRTLTPSFRKLTRPQHRTRCLPFWINKEKETLSSWCQRSIGMISQPIPSTRLPSQPQPWTLCNSQLTTHNSGRRKDARLTSCKAANTAQPLNNASTPHKRSTAAQRLRLNAAAAQLARLRARSLVLRGAADIRGVA
jgi:hypothetical protein